MIPDIETEGTLPNSFLSHSYSILNKYDGSKNSRAISLINMAAKTVNKILDHHFQEHSKKIICHY